MRLRRVAFNRGLDIGQGHVQVALAQFRQARQMVGVGVAGLGIQGRAVEFHGLLDAPGLMEL